MAGSLIPDPLELLRQAVNRLEGRANTLAGRGMEIEQVMKTLHQLTSASMTLRQAAEMAQDGFYKRLNLPTGREFAKMTATLQRVEDKLDGLLAAQGMLQAPAPKRTRQPAAAAAPALAASAAKPDAPVKSAKSAKSVKSVKAAEPAKAAAKRRTAAPASGAR